MRILGATLLTLLCATASAQVPSRIPAMEKMAAQCRADNREHLWWDLPYRDQTHEVGTAGSSAKIEDINAPLMYKLLGQHQVAVTEIHCHPSKQPADVYQRALHDFYAQDIVFPPGATEAQKWKLIEERRKDKTFDHAYVQVNKLMKFLGPIPSDDDFGAAAMHTITFAMKSPGTTANSRLLNVQEKSYELIEYGMKPSFKPKYQQEIDEAVHESLEAGVDFLCANLDIVPTPRCKGNPAAVDLPSSDALIKYLNEHTKFTIKRLASPDTYK
jgi:hypothetical protein